MKNRVISQGGAPGLDAGATGGGWRAMVSVAERGFGWPLVHLLFPDDCRVCGLPRTDVSSLPVCATCVAAVERQRGALCRRCGTAMGYESLRFSEALGMGECQVCRMAPPAFARAVAFAEYDGEAREILRLLKFERERAVAERMLGARLAVAVEGLFREAARELVVVPVPLHASRVRERGFNQSEVIARAAVKELRRTHRERKFELRVDVLRRTKATVPLFGLTPPQRRRVLEGAFRVEDGAAISGREVLLIDDIMTTGATARGCAGALLRAGAVKVWVATVARAQPETFGQDRGTAREPHADVSLWQ